MDDIKAKCHGQKYPIYQLAGGCSVGPKFYPLLAGDIIKKSEPQKPLSLKVVSVIFLVVVLLRKLFRLGDLMSYLIRC